MFDLHACMHAGAGTISGRGFPTYICANENTMINISALCDGYADCSDASDEINYLCESKRGMHIHIHILVDLHVTCVIYVTVKPPNKDTLGTI